MALYKDFGPWLISARVETPYKGMIQGLCRVLVKRATRLNLYTDF